MTTLTTETVPDTSLRLADIFESKQGKSTDKWASYLAVYDELFRPWRDKPIDLLEIGVQNGGSLEVWSAFFPHARHIVGCDIDPRCEALRFEDPAITVIVGDVTRQDTRAQVLAVADAYDILIDDGSHRSGDIVRAFADYLPRIKDGGVYVAEDLHCSYWRDFEGGLFDPYSSISFFKLLADVVNHQSWGIDRGRASLLAGFAERYQCAFDDEGLARIRSVTFINSICVVHLAPIPSNLLGVRHVVGSEAIVNEGSLVMHGRGPDYFPTQTSNPWTNRERPPAEQVEELERTVCELISKAEAQAAELADQARQTEQQAEALRLETARHEATRVERDMLNHELAATKATLSWRITEPIRYVRRLFVGRAH